MKAKSKELARDPSASDDQAPEDPFAVDVFAPENTSFDSSSAIFATSPSEDLETIPLNQGWTSRLPRVKPDQVEASAAIAGLPVETYARIQSSVVGVLSRYSMNPPEQISISLLELQEMDFASEVMETGEPPGVFATFNIDSNAAPVSLELGARFAAMLVDRMMGGDGAPPDSLRSLTRTERAVVEFLCLCCASELNVQTGEPLVRLQSLSDQPAWSTSRVPNASAPSAASAAVWKRGLVASLRIGVGDINGLTRVYLSAGALSAFDETNRSLRVTRQISTADLYTVEELARFARVTPDLSLTVLIGHTSLTLQELLELESGDVMVVEKPSLRWREQQVRGSLLLRVGDSQEALITGEVSENRDRVGDAVEAAHIQTSKAASLKMRVGAVSISPQPRFAERVKMEEEEETENGEELGEGASLLEAVMLTVRVELGARRLGLDELSRLRANQILDLGCQATDPVDLIVDDRRIARGELVDIEGQLGVRITQVLG